MDRSRSPPPRSAHGITEDGIAVSVVQGSAVGSGHGSLTVTSLFIVTVLELPLVTSCVEQRAGPSSSG